MYEIRRLSKEEIPAVTAKVNDIFFSEQGIPCELWVIAEEKDPVWWGAFLCAESEAEDAECVLQGAHSLPIATTAVYMEDGVQHMGRITVDKEMRGRGIGTEIVKYALTELFRAEEQSEDIVSEAGAGHGSSKLQKATDASVSEVRLDARPATVHIILNLGGEIAGSEYEFYGGICTPVKITKEKFLLQTENK